jgi:hypothetical protein
LLEKNGFTSLIQAIESECESVGLGDAPLTDKIRAYCKNQMFSPMCKMCSTPYRLWSNKHQAWAKYCSQKCIQSDPEVKSKNFCEDYSELVKKRESTMLEKYGVSSWSQTEEHKTAFAKRTKEAWSDTERREQRLEVRKETNLKRYGVSVVSQVPDVKQKQLETKRKNRESLSEEDREVADIARKNAYRKSRLTPEAHAKLTSFEFMHDLYVVKKTPVISCATEIGCSQGSIITALRELGIPYVPYVHNQESWDEIKLFEFIKSICPTAIRTYKIGKHLDIFVPELKLGFEYNGVYWHSDVKRAPDHHKKKVEHFYNHDIRYVQIWEDDWKNRQDVVKKFIINLIGKTKRIGARKTTIVELSQPEFTKFMDLNHMQGSTVSSVRLGLVYDGEIVAAMGFKETASNTKMKNGFELNRFANTNVNGAFAKLFKHFVSLRNPQFVSSFGDLEIIDKRKNVYLSNGFVQHAVIDPDYRYYDYRTKMREHKFGYRKSKFAKIGLDIKGKTERELAIEYKLIRCYDSGKIQYIWNQ